MGDGVGSSSEFFVGYLPVPARQRRFLVVAAVAIFLGLACGAGLIAARQRDPGPGQWHDAETSEFTGRIYEQPYPLLRASGADGSIRSMIIVQSGKHGAAEAMRGWDGRIASV